MKLRLELFVHNIEKSVEFYHDILEFNIPKEINEDYVPVRKGDVVLGLAEMKKLPDHHPIKKSGYNQQIGLGVEVVLEVEDVENVYHKVVTKGYPVQADLTQRSWGMVDFRIMDPDGYYLRITSRDGL